MRCWKCFRDTFIIHITADHYRICDLCYHSRKRVLAKIKANKAARAVLNKLHHIHHPRA